MEYNTKMNNTADKDIYNELVVKVRKQLEDLAEDSYAEFSAKLLPGTDNILGVRLPMLRKIAKTLVKQLPAKDGVKIYLANAGCQSFEEIMLQGFVIGYCKEPEDMLYQVVEQFLPLIDNWSVCDSFCTTLKRLPENRERCFTYLKECIERSDSRIYDRRFAVVMMLHYYIDEQYIDKVLTAMEISESEQYYVNMARAWCISMCFVRYEEQTMQFLKNTKINDFTFRMSIRKICESLVVDKEVKKKVREIKRDI